jgi:hypothetical protein
MSDRTTGMTKTRENSEMPARTTGDAKGKGKGKGKVSAIKRDPEIPTNGPIPISGTDMIMENIAHVIHGVFPDIIGVPLDLHIIATNMDDDFGDHDPDSPEVALRHLGIGFELTPNGYKIGFPNPSSPKPFPGSLMARGMADVQRFFGEVITMRSVMIMITPAMSDKMPFPPDPIAAFEAICRLVVTANGALEAVIQIEPRELMDGNEEEDTQVQELAVSSHVAPAARPAPSVMTFIPMTHKRGMDH